MGLRELLGHLQMEDLEGENCYQMAEAIGIEAFRKLVLVYGGGSCNAALTPAHMGQ